MPEVKSANATVLVADDNEANLGLLSGMLLLVAGCPLVCARNSDQAMNAVLEGTVDIEFLDVVMSGRLGFSACQQIKSNDRTRLAPVVLVTSRTDTDDRIHGITCGADDFLNKPVNKQELLARVQLFVAGCHRCSFSSIG